MILRLAALAAVAVLLPATVGSAQTAAELLQKGIYTQQTAGDVDGAIQVYRQVVGMTGVDRALAARAQMQLVSAFLQKGDFPGAAREFTTLAVNYGDQKEVVSAMTTAMRMAASMPFARPTGAQGMPSPPELSKGTLENGVYRHTATGTEIHVPSGWSVMGDCDSTGGGECVVLDDGSDQSYFVWMISEGTPVPEIPAALERDAEYKVHQRTVDGVKGFKMRPGTLFKSGSGTRQYLSAAFDFSQNGAQIEYDTWLRSDKSRAYFRAICPPSSIISVQDSLQMLVKATVIP
jgi:hypothetical protein